MPASWAATRRLLLALLLLPHLAAHAQQCGEGLELDVDYNGGDLPNVDGFRVNPVEGAVTVAQCCAACAANAACVRWTLGLGEPGVPSRCWIKGGGSVRTETPPGSGVVSGLPGTVPQDPPAPDGGRCVCELCPRRRRLPRSAKQTDKNRACQPEQHDFCLPLPARPRPPAPPAPPQTSP